ncbi:MAG: glycosyltransferase family 2 protein [Firmicutes bacterium]|nr:glycosyltransferase family 2 protein [Bacillota bacterium]
MTEPYLSIVIPAYNEEERLPKTLDRIIAYFGRLGQKDYEIVVVDDGSTDNTLALAQNYAARYPQITVVTNGTNRGKGYSVRHGLLVARGRIRLFSDSDLSTPIEETFKLLARLEEGYDLAIGSRYSPDANLVRSQPFYRRILRFGFNLLVRLITGLKYYDTQCGFKALTKESAELIAPRLSIPGFGFDPELLWIAERFGLRVAEVGVTWVDDRRSKVRPLRDAWRMFLDLIRIRIQDRAGRYR